METQTAKIRDSITKRIPFQETITDSGSFGCCDVLKLQTSIRNYWNVKIYFPKMEYVTWWLKEWIKILPEIEKRISEKNEDYILLPNTDENWYKHHFIWTIIRSCYCYPMCQRVYRIMMKWPDLNFLEVLRLVLVLSGINNTRFITNGDYFSLNVEKAREIFSKGEPAKMSTPFSGFYTGYGNSFLCSVTGIRNRIAAVNSKFALLDAIADIDKSGTFLFRKIGLYNMFSINNNVITFGYCGKMYRNELIRTAYYKEFKIAEDHINTIKKIFIPAEFDFKTYYKAHG